MSLLDKNVALNPLQWIATDDGWLDPGLAPPFRDRLQRIRGAGFDAIQTDVPEGTGLVEYATLLGEYGLRPGPGYVNLAWSDDAGARGEALDAARRLTAVNVALGTPLMFLAMGMEKSAVRIAHPAVGHNGTPEFLRRVRDYLAEAAEAIAFEGGIAALHPHVGTWVETETETRFVLDSTDPEIVGFGPDIGHLAWAGANVSELLSEYTSRIAGVHVKDMHQGIVTAARARNANYTDTVTSGLWTEPGRGDLDIDGALGALPTSFDGWIVIEVDRPSGDPDESVAACGQWLRSAIEKV